MYDNYFPFKPRWNLFTMMKPDQHLSLIQSRTTCLRRPLNLTFFYVASLLFGFVHLRLVRGLTLRRCIIWSLAIPNRFPSVPHLKSLAVYATIFVEKWISLAFSIKNKNPTNLRNPLAFKCNFHSNNFVSSSNRVIYSTLRTM